MNQATVMINQNAAGTADQGFTLVELLTTITIFSILLIIAIPSERYLFAQNQALTETEVLSAALNYSRSEAVTRNEKLIFCKSTDHKNCGGQWRDGQILIDAKKNLLRVFPSVSEKQDLVWNSSGGKDDEITWLPTGYTNGQRGTFYVCLDNAADSRSIVLLDTGRFYTSTVSAEDYGKFCLNKSD